MLQQSKQRITADNQFLKLQTRSLSRSRMASDLDTIVEQRAENMARLRALRLAKEEQERAIALASPATKKKRAKAVK